MRLASRSWLSRSRSAFSTSATTLFAILSLSGCTTQYIESAARIAAAEIGATSHFRWERNSTFGLHSRSSIYVLVGESAAPAPSSVSHRTLADLAAEELPWRLARIVAQGWDDTFNVHLGGQLQSLAMAQHSARELGADYVLVPRLLHDGDNRDLWHRRALTIELELREASTGRLVDRIRVFARAALRDSELSEPALVDALRALAQQLTGQPGHLDDRLGHLL